MRTAYFTLATAGALAATMTTAITIDADAYLEAYLESDLAAGPIDADKKVKKPKASEIKTEELWGRAAGANKMRPLSMNRTKYEARNGPRYILNSPKVGNTKVIKSELS